MKTLFSFIIKHPLTILYYVTIGYFSYLMALITIQYIPIDFNAALLNIKQDEITLGYYKVGFFTHVYSSIFTLLFGITQFSSSLRKKAPTLHRTFGKLYVGIILFLAAPSGLILAIHANGGLWSQVAFCILAVLWFVFTLKAFTTAKKKQFKNHKKWMLRSYALTLSAISLRLFKWTLANSLELPPMDTYKIIAWAGWMVNLAIVEWYIYTKRTPN